MLNNTKSNKLKMADSVPSIDGKRPKIPEKYLEALRKIYNEMSEETGKKHKIIIETHDREYKTATIGCYHGVPIEIYDMIPELSEFNGVYESIEAAYVKIKERYEATPKNEYSNNKYYYITIHTDSTNISQGRWRGAVIMNVVGKYRFVL